MSITIGFDLGTHQTKICIQDASNAAQKMYEFLEFEKPDGTTTVLFPSIVQINMDKTVSYGYPDESKCLFLKRKEIEEPTLRLKELPIKPTNFPSKRKAKYPKKPSVDPWKDPLLKLKGVKSPSERWAEECTVIDSEIEAEWNVSCEKILSEYELQCSEIEFENAKLREKYNEALLEWQESLEKEICRYRYFKLRAFTDSGVWKSQIFDSKVICVWYIAYILLKIREHIGDDISIQFGVPAGAAGTNRDLLITNRAYSLYIAAFNLAENYNNIDDYLATSYIELLKQTKIERVNEEVKDQYFFDDIPEAFAGLISVTTKKRLGFGFQMLVDIGGGTTDLAMFYVDSKTHLPDVIDIDSFPQGLNYIFENSSSGKKTIEELQEMFFTNSDNKIYRKAISLYKSILVDVGSKFQKHLISAFESSRYHHGRKTPELERAIQDQPIIFCGGGSVYDVIHSAIGFFTDKRKINKELLNIRNVRNSKNIPKELYAILAISYGLASFEKSFDEGIKCTSLSTVFQKCLPKVVFRDNHQEYGLLDD